MTDSFEFRVDDELPPLKGEAKSLLAEGHGQSKRVQALLGAALKAKREAGRNGFGGRRIGMELIVRPPWSAGSSLGDATNRLGGVGDALQSRASSVDRAYLGDLTQGFLYDDDAQIREVHYREEVGRQGYTVRLWELD